MQNVLTECKFCGVRSCVAHKKYTDRCEECGKRYAKYSSYKSLQRSDYTEKRQRRLEELILDYQMLKRNGYKVPRDIK